MPADFFSDLVVTINHERIIQICLAVPFKQKDTLVKYRYDSINRLVEEQYEAEATGYIYDLCGNHLEKLGIDGTEVYCYNKKNQLVSREKGRESFTAMICREMYWKQQERMV